MKITRLALPLLFILCCCFSLQAFEIHEVTVGVETSYPPYASISDSREPVGFSIELLEAVLDVMGYKASYMMDSFDKVSSALQTGKISILPVLARIPEREALYDFSFPYLTMHGTFVGRVSEKLPTSVEEVEHQRIAVMRGDTAHLYLKRFDKDLDIVDTDTFEQALDMLSNGTADLVCIQRYLAFELIGELGYENLEVSDRILDGFIQKFCFAVQEGDAEMVEMLNEGLATVIANGTFRRLQEAWFSPNNQQRRRLNTLIIGGDEALPPYEYLDENGEPAGFNVDLTRAIADKMNLNIEIRLGSWEEIYQGLQDGEIDMLQGLFYSSERDKTIAFSQPYILVNYGAVSRFGDPEIHDVNELAGKKVLVQKGDIMESMIADSGVAVQVMLVDDLYTALHMLSEGIADCALGPLNTLRSIISEEALDGLQVSDRPLASEEYNYAVLDSHDTWVYPFSEGIHDLKNDGMYREIYMKWFGDEQLFLGFSGEQMERFLLLVVIPGAIVFIIVLILIWVLRKEVRKRTADLTRLTGTLSEKVDELEAAKSSLMESEQRYEYAVEGTNEGLWDWNMNTGSLFFSKQYAHMLGYDPSQLRHDHGQWLELLHPDDLETAKGRIASYLAGPVGSYKSIYRLKASDGSYRWISTHGRLVRDENGVPERIVGFNSDITERIVAQRQQEVTEKKFQDLFDRITDPVCILDGSLNIIEINLSACRVIGYGKEEVLGRTFISFISDEEHGRWVSLRRRLLKEQDFITERTLKTREGHEIPTEIRVSLITYAGKKAVLAMARDITERKIIQASQQRNARLESLGVLAGGIAHDFNNLLSGIYGYMELARVSKDEPQIVEDCLDNAMISFSRTRKLTDQLLTFAKGGTPKRETGEIRQLIEDSVSFLLSGSNISYTISADEDTYLVDYDSGQMGQVIDNLIINAQQAMPMGGEISIRLQNEWISESSGALQSGQYISISIKDTGIGMSEELLDHIFDPYFTTKNKGNGLGLATCYSIIQKHDGMITAASVQGKGSVFTLYLPISKKRMECSKEDSVSSRNGDGKLIMIMDDEPVIRDITSKMLQAMGYTTMTSVSGEQTLQLLSENQGDPVAAVLCDLTIPGGMGGKEVAVVIRDLYPELPLFASSGYSDDPVMSNPQAYGFTGSIAKPYRMHELSGILSRSLDS